jgi:hypothetical protein
VAAAAILLTDSCQVFRRLRCSDNIYRDFWILYEASGLKPLATTDSIHRR